jgi:hypothetical protein
MQRGVWQDLRGKLPLDTAVTTVGLGGIATGTFMSLKNLIQTNNPFKSKASLERAILNNKLNSLDEKLTLIPVALGAAAGGMVLFRLAKKLFSRAEETEATELLHEVAEHHHLA